MVGHVSVFLSSDLEMGTLVWKMVIQNTLERDRETSRAVLNTCVRAYSSVRNHFNLIEGSHIDTSAVSARGVRARRRR